MARKERGKGKAKGGREAERELAPPS